jgi:hypothetical protein
MAVVSPHRGSIGDAVGDAVGAGRSGAEDKLECADRLLASERLDLRR